MTAADYDFDRLPDRRSVLARLATALGALSCTGVAGAATAQGADGTPFTRRDVLEAARTLSQSPYKAPQSVPDALRDLDYDTYRKIGFKADQAVWGRAPTPFSVQFFAPGYLYRQAVEIEIVEGGRTRPLPIGVDSFDAPTPEISGLLSDFARFAGFRLHYPINSPGSKEEFVVFQGASYFRAVSKDQVYGLSARGLAIDVAEPSGEEFPVFRRFWIERPSSSAHAIAVHALLDSPSVSGAYRFAIYPGDTTVLGVDATLFPRKRLTHVGLGALTSMFLHGPADGPDIPDYRPSVHDSLGLAMQTGTGERLWRPLTNPRTLQISGFMDENPRGFGLVQRSRRFAAYQDLEARYERRPSGWIEPGGNWGKGEVVLVEIPTPHEGNDNIIAYWRPDSPIEAGTDYQFAYRMIWPDDVPAPRRLANVVRSAYGRALQGNLPQVTIDYDRMPGARPDDLTIEATASTGRIADVTHLPNPETGGIRIFVSFDPDGANVCELRIRPTWQGRPVGETWLYRWTGS